MQSLIFHKVYQIDTFIIALMIIKSLKEISRSNRDVNWGRGQSRRFLIEEDKFGMSFNDTTMDAGAEITMQYTNHDEAVYCLEGKGEINFNGRTIEIEPGTFYAVKKNEKVLLKAITKMRFVCVFIPALKGNEKHNLESSASGY